MCQHEEQEQHDRSGLDQTPAQKEVEQHDDAEHEKFEQHE